MLYAGLAGSLPATQGGRMALFDPTLKVVGTSHGTATGNRITEVGGQAPAGPADSAKPGGGWFARWGGLPAGLLPAPGRPPPSGQAGWAFI